jgi:hypothetical protein
MTTTPRTSIFQFGQRLPEYAVPVLNERAVRASAGILFFFAMLAFMHAWLKANFQPTRLFVLVFLVDFAIRLFVNPKYAPSLIVGQWIVRKQRPDYVGAPQKRFAWGIGFALALLMFYLLVLNQVVGPINVVVCGLCLTLMFFESAFGICIGCKLYNLIYKDQAQLCPGGVCEVPTDQIFRTSASQLLVLIASLVGTVLAAQWVYSSAPPSQIPSLGGQSGAVVPALNANEVARCKVPEFAKAIGHEAQWKLHNHCP